MKILNSVSFIFKSRNTHGSRISAKLAVFLAGLLLPYLLLSAAALAEPIGKRIVLENGMVLLLAERHTLPVVSINVMIKAGEINLPPEKAGTAYLTGSLLTEGTKTLTSNDISEAIEYVGGGLTSSGGMETSSVALGVLKKDLPLGLELLSDVLINPTFPAKELERKKKELAGAIASKEDDPETLAEEAFLKALYPDHPYGRPVEGSLKTLAKIRREDLVGFYNQFYVPNNAIIAVVGDVTEEEIVRELNQAFKSWKPKTVPPFPAAPKETITTQKTVFLNMKITQANVVLGFPGISRGNPDFYAVSVMNYILGGGGFASRLMDNIRDNKGLAYDVHSAFNANKFGGDFEAVMQTKNESAKEAIAETIKELKRIQDEPVSDQELTDAKAFLTGYFALRMDTNTKISSLMTNIEYYGLGFDFPTRYPDYINNITKEDIQRVARKYLHPDAYLLVIVANGDKAKIQ